MSSSLLGRFSGRCHGLIRRLSPPRVPWALVPGLRSAPSSFRWHEGDSWSVSSSPRSSCLAITPRVASSEAVPIPCSRMRSRSTPDRVSGRSPPRWQWSSSGSPFWCWRSSCGSTTYARNCRESTNGVESRTTDLPGRRGCRLRLDPDHPLCALPDHGSPFFRRTDDGGLPAERLLVHLLPEALQPERLLALPHSRRAAGQLPTPDRSLRDAGAPDLGPRHHLRDDGGARLPRALPGPRGGVLCAPARHGDSGDHPWSRVSPLRRPDQLAHGVAHHGVADAHRLDDALRVHRLSRLPQPLRPDDRRSGSSARRERMDNLPHGDT